MYAVSVAKFTAEEIADILVNRHLPLWRLPISLLSNHGHLLCFKLSLDVYKRLDMRKIATGTHHPDGNDGVEQVSHTVAQKVAIIVNERLDDWNLHLPHLEAAYSSPIYISTRYSPKRGAHEPPPVPTLAIASSGRLSEPRPQPPRILPSCR